MLVIAVEEGLGHFNLVGTRATVKDHVTRRDLDVLSELDVGEVVVQVGADAGKDLLPAAYWDKLRETPTLD